jgi:cysteine desulfurase
MLIQLDQEGVAVSTGSACASGSPLPSHVLLAMGLPRKDAQASLRLSLSHRNRDEDVDRLLEVLPQCVEKQRSLRVFGRSR